MQLRTRRDFLSLAGKGLGLAALSSATVASLLRTVEAATKTVADQPLKLESVGFKLDYYNPATNHAGDMVFTHEDHDLSGHFHLIWSDFGTQDPRSPNDPTKTNVQPVFVLPLGTKVAHKTGTGARGYMDAGIVFKDGRPLFILTAYTDHVPAALPDGTPGFAAAAQLIGRMARLCYDRLG